MALEPGLQLGSYEVLALLGRGGMGEVYRARDRKLGRDVALKVLAEDVSLDQGRLARFEREAKLLASLNHSNIASIYGLEDECETPILVLELVEGEDLSDRLRRGPIPLGDALDVARQMAEALEAAHEKGIVHRDLKPANVKVTAEGRVKILDFGLAKAWADDPPPGTASSAALSQSPTLARTDTEVGLILGTAGYMSPEQARGKALDKRADIWAFGVVLFEMLAGRRLFEGETVSDALASVMKDEPDWSSLPDETPVPVRRLLRRCLEKDPRSRLRDIGDARLELSETEPLETSAIRDEPGPSPVWGRASTWVVGLTTLALAVALWSPWHSPAPRPQPVRFELTLTPDRSLGSEAVPNGPRCVLSPDGRRLAFVAWDAEGRALIHTRPLNRLEATPVSGTEGARDPFFSPDGEWIGFFADGSLKRVPVGGGPPVALCQARAPRGGTWGPNGDIIFAPDGSVRSGLWRVSSDGGPCTPLGAPEDHPAEVTHRWPQWLPDGQSVLYTAHSQLGDFEDAQLVVQSLVDGGRQTVYRGGYHGRYHASGHLMWVREGTLFAAPFDLSSRELTGAPIPVVESIESRPWNGGAQFAFAENQTLVYMASGSSTAMPIHWLARDGSDGVLRPDPVNWARPRFSPTGDRLAMHVSEAGRLDVWVHDWSRRAATRLTFDPDNDTSPVWTPDGRRIVFASQRSGISNLYWRRSDGTGEVQRLTESGNRQVPRSWHPDGRRLALFEVRPDTGADILILELQGTEETGWTPAGVTEFLTTPFDETGAAFSPDGRWMAYRSTESGRSEIYVRPFPGPGGKWLVSTRGGTTPRWSRTRSELLYLALDRKIMVVPFAVEGNTFTPGTPRPWPAARAASRHQGGGYDIHPDGERLALGIAASDTRTVVVSTGFFDELLR